MTRPALWPAVLALVLALAAPAAAAPIRGSVVGGEDAAAESWPFAAALVVRGEPAERGQFCGGSIADERHVITAAHCVEGESASRIDVVAGRLRLAGEGGHRVGVASIAVQPAYDTDAVIHDIAVLRLAEPLAAGTPIAPAGPAEADLARAGAPVRVAGWGLVSQSPPSGPTVLQQAGLTVFGPSRCRKAYGSLDPNTQICAGTPETGVPDSCQGDSGGPLVADGPAGPRLVGVVSYGGDVCGDPASPGVYTRVSGESEFVSAQLGGAPPPPPGPEPPAGELDPRVEIGRIWCGSRCYVEVGASGPGAGSVPQLLVRVKRSRRGSRPAYDKTFSAKRLSNTRWRAKVGLPYGVLRISARATDAKRRTIGSTDRVGVEVVP
ncbi:MAG TPA: serine protease [Thermoleophilaceae bacterium]